MGGKIPGQSPLKRNRRRGCGGIYSGESRKRNRAIGWLAYEVAINSRAPTVPPPTITSEEESRQAARIVHVAEELAALR